MNIKPLARNSYKMLEAEEIDKERNYPYFKGIAENPQVAGNRCSRSRRCCRRKGKLRWKLPLVIRYFTSKICRYRGSQG